MLLLCIPTCSHMLVCARIAGRGAYYRVYLDGQALPDANTLELSLCNFALLLRCLYLFVGFGGLAASLQLLSLLTCVQHAAFERSRCKLARTQAPLVSANVDLRSNR